MRDLINLVESVGSNLYADLEAIGFEKKPSLTRVEQGFKGDVGYNDVVDVLMSHGFKPVTHYRLRGEPMPKPYTEFEKAAPYGGPKASLHLRDGKVFYMVVDHRRSND